MTKLQELFMNINVKLYEYVRKQATSIYLFILL